MGISHMYSIDTSKEEEPHINSQGNTHRSRVAKCFPQLAADIRLGSKIQLLE